VLAGCPPRCRLPWGAWVGEAWLGVQRQGRGLWSSTSLFSSPCRLLPGLVVLDLPWDYHFLGLLADGHHLPDLRMVCLEGKGGKPVPHGETVSSCLWSHHSLAPQDPGFYFCPGLNFPIADRARLRANDRLPPRPHPGTAGTRHGPAAALHRSLAASGSEDKSLQRAPVQGELHWASGLDGETS